MPIHWPDNGSELSPDCRWQECSLFELPAGRSVRLTRNGQTEAWLLVLGKACLSADGASRSLDAPAPIPPPGGTDWMLTAANRLVLLHWHHKAGG